MSPNVFEINEDKIYKDKCCGKFYAMFFLIMLKKKCGTSTNFAGPADARCYWSYRASIILRPVQVSFSHPKEMAFTKKKNLYCLFTVNK